ncbi:hypothetical protein Sme01_18500 [Sphaerisporangium melleum]|uniref:Uncharacterized protein n=1 Tax=Sphaerisporangium melleum TaxID=321316 RepID=A0A917RN60_9ACTN|nr:hypothetical protein [Sphaerisporangium melleum]GGL14655.1 hypothetical protein GCM10007964_65870 [Sphaerisporangium melleum]GII69374.1 hypothetical protein Sme01_18500 [Sphaerisporangium melleum]
MEILIGAVVLALIVFFLTPPARPKRKAPSVGSLIVGGLVAGAAVAAVLAVIAWRDILAWFQPRLTDGDIGELIKTKIASGDYAKTSLRGEIRDARDGTLKHSKSWEGRLDDDLKRRFGTSDKITIGG